MTCVYTRDPEARCNDDWALHRNRKSNARCRWMKSNIATNLDRCRSSSLAVKHLAWAHWSNLLTATSGGFLLILGSAVNNYQQVSLVGTPWNIKLVECFQLPNTNSLCVYIHTHIILYYIERWCHLAVPDPTALGSRRIDVAKCLV